MIKLAVAEDNQSYLKALQALINSRPDLQLVYSGENLYDIEGLCHSNPDVIILDIDLPGVNGIQGLKLIKEKNPGIGIFMLTVFEDDDKIFNAIKAGADGYLLKIDPPEKIIEAIYAIYNGESIINGRIARKMLDYFTGQNNKKKQELEKFRLTKREKEILQLLIEGKSYKLIADLCNISLQTLFSHTRNIYNKLNIHSRSEIAARFG